MDKEFKQIQKTFAGIANLRKWHAQEIDPSNPKQFGHRWVLFKDICDLNLESLHSIFNRMFKQPQNARDFFGACKHCEPVMCCPGLSNECYCLGQPVDFQPTSKCGADCIGKMWFDKDLEIKDLKRLVVKASEQSKAWGAHGMDMFSGSEFRDRANKILESDPELKKQYGRG